MEGMLSRFRAFLATMRESNGRFVQVVLNMKSPFTNAVLKVFVCVGSVYDKKGRIFTGVPEVV